MAEQGKEDVHRVHSLHGYGATTSLTSGRWSSDKDVEDPLWYGLTLPGLEPLYPAISAT